MSNKEYNDYEVYRNTTLGDTLQETLDDFVSSNKLSEHMARKVFKEFDKAINKTLATKVKTKVQFKANLDTYRLCDNVWTLVLNNFSYSVQDQQDKKTHSTPIDKVKIVAVEARQSDKKGAKTSNEDDLE